MKKKIDEHQALLDEMLKGEGLVQVDTKLPVSPAVAECPVPGTHIGSFTVNANQVTASCPRCKNNTLFRILSGWPCNRIHMDDGLYCETCGIEITGKAFGGR